MNLQHARKIAYGQSIDFNQNDFAFRLGDVEDSRANEEKHSIPCEQCNMPHGSCIAPPTNTLHNLRGVMVGRLARDNPIALADVDRYFFGEPTNPCSSRREVLEKYISFVERIYPRRCCDEHELVSSRMATDTEQPITHNRPFCNICKEFSLDYSSSLHDNEKSEEQAQDEDDFADSIALANQADTKRRKRHMQKYGNAKMVSGIIDSAIQPTLGILYGQRGNNLFRRELHRLSRDMNVRNCGPAYILRKAMSAIPPDVWDRPFGLNETEVNYIPSR